MKPSFLSRFLLVVFLVGVAGGSAWWYQYQEEILLQTKLLQQQEDKLPYDPAPEEELQLIEQDWVSFEVPRHFPGASYELEMELLKAVDQVEVTWAHSASGQQEAYTLERFDRGASSASYRIDPALGNMLPGVNTYTIVATQEPSETSGERQTYQVRFEMRLDLEDLRELSPELVKLDRYQEELDEGPFEVVGTITALAKKAQVYSYHAKDQSVTFAELRRFDPNEKAFRYNVEERLGNLVPGDNLYVIEFLDDARQVVARKRFEIRLNKFTLEDEVKDLFGGFEQVRGGWFVSQKLPWFSLRPVFGDYLAVADDSQVLLPRPTLQYLYEADQETKLCDYLGSLDYEAEGMSYRGYSFETCQEYRYGVSVYDRFLSVLVHKPVDVVKRTDYKDVEGTVSSAFVMMETGGMKPIDEVTEVPETESAEEAPQRYYVFQMLITGEKDYTDKQIGDIQEELSDERRDDIDRVTALLKAYPGDQLFSDVLYPEQEQEESRAAAPSSTRQSLETGLDL